MKALRVGTMGAGIPIAITVLASDLLPDCTTVVQSRFRIFRLTDDATSAGQVVAVTITQAAVESYVARYITQAADVAMLGTLYIYVESLSGGVWIPTSTPIAVPVINHR